MSKKYLTELFKELSQVLISDDFGKKETQDEEIGLLDNRTIAL